MNMKVNFSGRALRYTEDEIATVVEAMRSAEPLTQGLYRDAFEAKFADYQAVPRGTCFTVMNGVSALELSAQLCQLQPGDEVIMPSHTFTASAYPYAKKGARLVWADIDLHSRVVSAQSIARVIGPRTKAIVLVHLYGYVADMPAIMALAQERGLLVIEDAAQSIGASLDGVKSGAFGDMAIFSFHSHKNLTTLGEGGMLYVREPALAALVPMLRHNGHCAFAYERSEYWKPAMGNVDMPLLHGQMMWPNNYCLGEVECALGAKMLDRIDTINAEKRARAVRVIDALADCPALEFHRVDTERHNYHLLAARVIDTNTGASDTARRDALIRTLYHDHGVKCVVQYMPLNRYDFYKRIGLAEAQCPHADAFYDGMISLPFQHWLSDEECAYMVTALKAAYAATTPL